MTVNLDVTFDREQTPVVPEVIRGGLRITVDGARVLQFENEEATEWHDWEPEYLGDRILLNLTNLLTALTSILEGETGLYEISTVRIEGTRNRIVLEHLSENRVRVAFHVLPPIGGKETLQPAADSERGYLVNANELGDEVLATGQHLLTFAEELGFGSDELTQLTEAIEDLESVRQGDG